MIHFGYISAVDAIKGLYRVNLDDKEVVTDWLRRIELNTKHAADCTPFEEGEHVVVDLDEHLENGIILGAIYDAKNLPPAAIANENIRGIEFPDGTKIIYDSSSSTYEINSAGKVVITAATDVEITCNTVKITGDLTVTGDIKTTLGDVKAGTISLKTHVHPAGSPNTGIPVP